MLNYTKFKRIDLNHWFINKCGGIPEKRNFFTKDQPNVLLDSCRYETFPIKTKNRTCLTISCNMSSTNNEGGGNIIEFADKTKKSVDISRSFKRKSKFKGLSKSYKNCKRCKSNTTGEINSATVKIEPPTNMKNHTNSLYKTVHVEFMESQNLKDFGLNKSPSLPINLNNSNRNSVLSKIEPIFAPNDAEVPNVSQTGGNKALNSFETYDIEGSNRHSEIQENRTNGLRQDTVTVDKSKLTKAQRSSGSGGHGGNSDGDGDDKKVFKGEEINSSNAQRKKFWRTFSLTLLPFILGLTTYVISDIGAIEMLKLMSNARSIDEPLPINAWSTFNGTDSETEHLDLGETESGDAEYFTDIESPFEHIDIPEFLH